jgi:hypothetical protein
VIDYREEDYMPTTHGTLPRGIDATRSQQFEGRFGRMFRNLPPAVFGASDAESRDNLHALAEKMNGGDDTAQDGHDAEESGIPALYTYFGQFIDHDITYDPVSTLTKSLDPDGLVDFRTPSFNLDNMYGRGPGDQPYMFDGNKFRLGNVLKGAGVPDTHDLPRFDGRALIGDPRNDENGLVSQLQGLMLRIHNRMVDENPTATFEDVQQLLRFHYQYVVLNDFLPRIVSASVLNELKTDGVYDQGKLRFYHWRNYPFMPVEFSVAAYRLGHSMVRPGYRLNDGKLVPIFPSDAHPHESALTGFRAIPHGYALDWARFIDIEERAPGGEAPATDAGSKRRLQFAYKIDTSVVGSLHSLPLTIAGDPPPSLGERNLLRGMVLGLPSGQAVARAMGVPELTDDEIIIGKATGDSEDPQTKIADISPAFAGNCPLWTYILAEAALPTNKIDVPIPVTGGGTRSTPQLGAVGGRIVAEVFLGMAFGDGLSYPSLDPLWTPRPNQVPKADFGLRDLVSYGLGHGAPLIYR